MRTALLLLAISTSAVAAPPGIGKLERDQPSDGKAGPVTGDGSTTGSTNLCVDVAAMYAALESSIATMFDKLKVEVGGEIAALKLQPSSPARNDQIKQLEVQSAALDTQKAKTIEELHKQRDKALATCAKSAETNRGALCGNALRDAIVVVVEPAFVDGVAAISKLTTRRPASGLIGVEGDGSAKQANAAPVIIEHGGAFLSAQGTATERASRAVAALMLKRSNLVVVQLDQPLTPEQRKQATGWGWRIASSKDDVRKSACN